MISKKSLHGKTWKTLSAFFETPEIISKIICFKDCLRVETVSLEELRHNKLRGDDVLNEFESRYFIARERYFSSHFNPKLSEDYMYSYFILLEHLLNKLQSCSEYSQKLEFLLTMEVCGVFRNESVKPDLAAVFSYEILFICYRDFDILILKIVQNFFLWLHCRKIRTN